MALSNLRNEPRREITEQVVGVALFAAYIGLDYVIVWALGAQKTQDWIFGMILIALSLPFAIGFLYFLTIAIHAIGDIACDVLGDFGLDPRPRQRYRR